MLKKLDHFFKLRSLLNYNSRKFCSSSFIIFEEGNLKKKKAVNDIERQNFFDQLSPVIGLEIHAQLNLNTKLFSSAGYDYKSIPNSKVSYFDSSLPGTLPVLNEEAIKLAIKTGLAFNCEISKYCTFDRKHYFYPDMPNGFQITQNKNPIAKNGFLNFIVHEPLKQSYLKKINLKQIQLEQDSGKSIIDEKQNKVFIDLNRVGVGLLEFVFEPELYTAKEAVCLLKELNLTLKRLGVSSAKMEEGCFRVDSNISVHKKGEPLGTRVELKNLNSFKFIEEAINFEIQRHKEMLYSNQEIINETRFYDFKNKKTYSLRDKEVVQDYRFIPESNLIPLKVDSKDFLKQDLPKLPKDDKEILLNQYSLSLDQTYKIIFIEGFSKVFDFLNKKNQNNENHSVKKSAYFVSEILNSFISMYNIELRKARITLDFLNECYELFISNIITDNTVIELLSLQHNAKSSKKNYLAKDYVKELGWSIFDDQNLIEEMVKKVLDNNEHLVKKYKKKQNNYNFKNLRICLDYNFKHTIPEKLLKDAIHKILFENEN